MVWWLVNGLFFVGAAYFGWRAWRENRYSESYVAYAYFIYMLLLLLVGITSTGLKILIGIYY